MVKMRRLSITAPVRQIEYIERLSSHLGLPRAEIVRRIIDDHAGVSPFRVRPESTLTYKRRDV